uniref:Protein lifeguard 1 n=1 Tax=Rhabditophanes sp. KR3021 TaxID=114890 RepID=A0AC35TG01_9BILA
MAYSNPPPPNFNGYSQNTGYNPQGQNPYQAMPPPGWNQQATNNPYNSQGPITYGQNQPTMQYSSSQAETGEGQKRFDFSEASIRAAFVKKVFMMVTVMLTVVAIMTAIPFFNPVVKKTIQGNLALYLASYGTFLVVYIVLMCCESVRRSYPSNIICTAVLTLSIGYMTMMISSMYDIQAVFLTLAVTTVVCGGIIIFSSTTTYDLTSKIGIIAIFSMVVFGFGMVVIITSWFIKIKGLMMVYSAIAALLFAVYLALDIQMLMGGKKYEISPEDHIFCISSETSNYNYGYVYTQPNEDKSKTKSFQISVISNGTKSLWRTITDNREPVLAESHKPSEFKKVKNLINSQISLFKDFKGDNKVYPLFNTIKKVPGSVLSDIRRHQSLRRKPTMSSDWIATNTDGTKTNSLKNYYSANKNEDVRQFNVINDPTQIPNPFNSFSSQLQPFKFLELPKDEHPVKSFVQKMDFGWFGSRYFERHSFIPSHLVQNSFVSEQTNNATFNDRNFFDEMQGKLNSMFKDSKV